MRRTLLVVPFIALLACGGAPASDGVAADDQALVACSPSSRAEVILWTQDAWLLDLASRLTPNAACMAFYVGVPLDASDKTKFHPEVEQEIARVHALGSNFHALAEFNWAAWQGWVDAGHGDWTAAAATFRQEMDDAGFDTFPGNSDTWLVQEFPTTLVHGRNGVSADTVRAHAVDVVRTLHENGKVHKLGATARAGDASHVTNVDGMVTDRGYLEELLSDGAFWREMSQHVRWWGEEVYAEPRDVCVESADVAERARAVDDFVFHVPRLADANPAATAEARAFFAKSFTPWLNGAWGTDGGYGDVRVTADQMGEFVSTQVYAVRAWAQKHDVPAGRLAWSWAPDSNEPPGQLDAVEHRLAASIDAAYDPNGGTASRACSPSGAFTFCQCNVAGAAFEDSWTNVFGVWK
jgi:hypothetical protein